MLSRLRHNREVIQVLMLTTLLFLSTACQYTVTITEQMTWECLPEWYTRDYPNAKPLPGGQAVRFLYVRNPHVYDVVTGRELCSRLEASNNKIVEVKIEAHGSRSGVIGYHFLSVQGQPIINVGGVDMTGIDGTGQHPLDTYFR